MKKSKRKAKLDRPETIEIPPTEFTPDTWMLCQYCNGEGCSIWHGQGAFWTDPQGKVLDGLPPHLESIASQLRGYAL